MAFNRVRDIGERGLHSGVSTLGGFRKFILRGNVVDLAVGIVIGAAFTGVVNAFVKDVITPLIPVSKDQSLATWTVMLPYSNAKLLLGDLIVVIIAFLITALIVYYLVVLPVNALHDRFTPHKEEAPTTRDCPFCLSSIPLKATRCPFCTSQLLPADQTPGVVTNG